MRLRVVVLCGVGLALIGGGFVAGYLMMGSSPAEPPPVAAAPAIAPGAQPVQTRVSVATHASAETGVNASGPASDLREVGAKVVRDLLQCPEIVRNPYRITIVMKDIVNKTEDMPGRDLSIYVAKLTSRLNAGETADRLLFVEQSAALRNLQAQETGTLDPAGNGGAHGNGISPQYVLTGELHSMNSGGNVYYLLTFRLTNLSTGAMIWNGNYEMRTLN